MISELRTNEINSKKLILRNLKGEMTEKIPIWFMRQAGRYLPEYRKLRKGKTFEDMCQNPEFVTELTLQPIHRFQLDAAIIFSDILVPLYSLNRGLSIQPNKGPIITNPIRNKSDIHQLRIPDPKEDFPYLQESITKVRKELTDIALIGFAGGPFTLASYLIEGKSTKDGLITKAYAWKYPKAFATLMNLLVEAIIRQLTVQVEAGVDIIQVFDSWAGYLSLNQYKSLALPFTKRIFASKELSQIPRIHYARGAGHLLEGFLATGATTISVDTSLDFETNLSLIPTKYSFQGNLDPAVLHTSPKIVHQRVKKLLETTQRRSGYIFNLGKGIDKNASLENVETMINTVRSFKRIN